MEGLSRGSIWQILCWMYNYKYDTHTRYWCMWTDLPTIQFYNPTLQKVHSYSLVRDPPSHLSTYCCHLWSKSSPSVIAYCKQSKTGCLGTSLLPPANIVTDPWEVVYDYLSLCIFKNRHCFLFCPLFFPWDIWVLYGATNIQWCRCDVIVKTNHAKLIWFMVCL